MDFQSFKRRDLQSLCKLNNIPANTTNTTMADALASLPTVEGLAEFLAKPDTETQGSPERSALASSYAPRTTATRTRCSTRTRAVEGTGTRKTPATQTARKRATRESSIQKKMEIDMEAEFEAEKKQSEVTDSNLISGGKIKEISEVDSGVNVDIEGQSEPQKEVQQQVNDGQEVINLDDSIVNEAQDEATEMSNDIKKVDFHSLNRKDLQNLCKKNKKPANTTNAAMAAALESLEFVEGLQEFLNECDSQAPSSPLMSGIASCARRSRTTMKVTREEPQSSKLITKSCRGSRRRIVEQNDQGKDDVPETQEKEDNSEVSAVAEFNGDISKSLTQEAPVNEPTLQDESGEGNNDLLNVENLTESSELVAKVDDENVVEEENLETLEVANFAIHEEDLKLGSADSELVAKVDDENVVEEESLETLEVTEAVANFAIQEEELKLGSSDSELETNAVQNSLEIESQDAQLENLSSAPAFAAESLVENLAITHVSECTTEVDQVNLEINEDSKSGSTKPEKVVTFSFDSAVLEPAADAESAEDEVSEELNTAFSSADEPSLETNVESEGSCNEDEVSEWSDYEMPKEDDEVSDSEPAIQDDLLSLEANVDSESEKSQLEKLDITTDPTEWVEKPEVSLSELLANQFDTESTIQFRSCVPTESKTPLDHKSLRKLKRMYKEKLQEKTLVKGIEKLDLDDTEVPLTNVDESLQEGNVEALVMHCSKEANEEDIDESEDDIVDDTEISVIQETSMTNAVAETANLIPVDILVDNEVVSEDAVVGNITVVPCSTQTTPSKCSSMTKKPLMVTMVTPTKSSCKTPKSAVKINRVMDVNKENIDNSISKTEPGKLKVAVTESGKILSALSMGKLKKEFKGLQQSDRKKQVLQSRSDNLLASP